MTSIEIIRPQLATLRRWEQQTGYPALTALLSDPRIEHVFGDGRIHILRSERRFDIIEAQREALLSYRGTGRTSAFYVERLG